MTCSVEQAELALAHCAQVSWGDSLQPGHIWSHLLILADGVSRATWLKIDSSLTSHHNF